MSGDPLTAPASLRHRHRKSGLFAVLAAGSLGLGLVVVVVLVFATLREGMLLSSMHATASAGLALSQRSAALGGDKLPYVTVAQVLGSDNSAADGSAAAAPPSPAARLGLLQGDALLSIGGTTVLDVRHVWNAVGALPRSQQQAEVTWVPNLEAMFGELEAVPIPEQPGVFRTRIGWIGEQTIGSRAGLRDGDVLVSVDGLPLRGSQQAWQTVVLAARASTAPLQLVVERDGRSEQVPFEVRRRGDLPLDRSLTAALWRFVTSLDEPRYPEHAGLSSAILGSLLVVLVTIVFAFPLGVAAAVYLEEYARRSRLTSVLQVLIANLAGIPSVVYGILGLEIIARTLNLGRSILAGGVTLGLLILPVMILGCREALRTVPPWVRQAAFAVGATPSQVVWYQVLPYALPGMMTAMILAVSRAIGEAAPLIMLGAFLYVTYNPSGLMDTFTVVPLQIFSWATRPQAGYETIAAVAILVLMALLLLLNGAAIVLRNRFQLRW